MTSRLAEGIAVVIDDEIGKQGGSAKINNIIKTIELNNFPCVKYTEIPDLDVINHFHGISFIVLDWIFKSSELTDENTMHGVTIPDSISESSKEDLIKFIKEIKNKCFSPIFIFTSEAISEVEDILKANDLIIEGKPNFIIVKNKSDFDGQELFDYIDNWIKKTPSVYVLNEWEKEYSRAKSNLFNDFYDMSSSWPIVLWSNYSDDGVNQSIGLGDVISRNLHTRMSPFEFDETVFNSDKSTIDAKEIRRVLSGEKFISNEGLHDTAISTGDIFRIKGKYYINIRPECDCIPGRHPGEQTLDEVGLYLLKADKFTPGVNNFNKDFGSFTEQDSNAKVSFVKPDLSLEFKFKILKIEKWGDIKNKRLGRLLAPYITRIQQRYSHYLQRQALSRVPSAALEEVAAEVKKSVS